MVRTMVEKNRWVRSMIASILTVGLLLSPLQTLAVSANEPVGESETGAADQSLEITETQLEALEAIAEVSDDLTGLVGFEGAYELADDASPVSVIVVFNSSPAEVQLIEAQVFGDEYGAATLAEAEANVEADHESFSEDLGELLDGPLSRFGFSSYEIEWEYRRALNGVAVTVPSDQVEEIAGFDSVAFIFPNETVSIPEPVLVDDVSTLETSLGEGSTSGDPLGMRDARLQMNAHLLHELGYRGEGVLVAVLDTGIDYYHPAFAGAFPTLEDMYERNPDNPYLGDWAGIAGAGLPAAQLGANPVPAVMPDYDYFFGRNFILGNGWAAWNDPQETSPGHPAGAPGTNGFNNTVNPAQTTSHGTHVAGSILGRDTGNPMSILGVAPEAQMIAYRVLGPGGAGQAGAVIAGINMAYYDHPDIVNMSLGGGGAAPFVATSLAVNNIVLQRPNIIFTNSQGNSGPNFSTLSAPASASLGIGVSSLAAPGYFGLRAEFPIGDFERTLGGTTHAVTGETLLTHVYGNAETNFEWSALGPGSHLIHTLPAFSATSTGDIPLVVLPTAAPRNPAAATVPSATGGQNNIGLGTRADFELLFDLYTEEELEGAWVVVARQNSGQLARVSTFAYYYGLAGVVSLTNEGTLNTGGIQQAHLGNGNAWAGHAPQLMVDHLLGLAILDAMPTVEPGAPIANSARGRLTFRLTDFYGDLEPLRLSGFSSRGPVLQTFEIKPDIGAQGQGVLSAVPRWTVERPWEMTGGSQPWQGSGNEGYFAGAYQVSSGTSMSAPTVAGAAALMVQYSREHHGVAWQADEVKTRMMNNSIVLDYEDRGYGIFDMGAGQVDVYAAVHAEDVVYVTFPDAVPAMANQLEETGFISTRTGSFSFGGSTNSFGRDADGNRTRTLTATIENQSGSQRTYELSYRFIQSGRLSQDPSYANLSFSESTVTVPAGGSVDIDVTMTLDTDAPEGHYEGFVLVTQNGQQAALLPFAAVGQGDVGIVEDVFLGRPVISMDAYHSTGSELTLYFTALIPLAFETFVIEATNEEIDFGNLPEASHVGTRHVPLTGNQNRAVVFSPTLVPETSPLRTLEEGDYLLVLKVHPFISTVPGRFYETITLPFSVDNTSPNIDEIEVNEEAVIDSNHVILTMEETYDLALSGNVADIGLATAIANEVTFDIWLDTAADGPEVSLENNLAVYVLFGESTQANRPERVAVNNTGDFTVSFEEVDTSEEIEVTIWAVDHYTAVPNSNTFLGALATSDIWSHVTPFPGTNFFNGTDVTPIFPALTSYLQFAPAPIAGVQTGAGNIALFQQHVWGGLNVEEHAFTVSFERIIPVTTIGNIPSEWAVNVPLDLNDVAVVLPTDATNQAINWEIEDGDATLIDGVLVPTSAGDLTLLATIAEGTYDTNTGDLIDFVQTVEITVEDYLYVNVIFEGNGGLVALLESGPDQSIEDDTADLSEVLPSEQETVDATQEETDPDELEVATDSDEGEEDQVTAHGDTDESVTESTEETDAVQDLTQDESVVVTATAFEPYVVLPVRLGQPIGDALPIAQRTGYDFLEWNTSNYGNGTVIDANTIVLEGMTAYATWYFSEDAALTHLEAYPFVLSPEFNPNVFSYRVDIDYAITSILLTMATSHGGATVEVTGPNGQALLPVEGSTNTFLAEHLAVGENTLTVTVQAVAGNTEVYTVVVNRAAPPVIDGPAPTVHTVSFNLHGGSGDFPSQQVAAGQFATKPSAEPVRSGYTFTGWFTAETEGAAFDFSTPITGDTIIHAQWEQEADVAAGRTPGTAGTPGAPGTTTIPGTTPGRRLPQTGSTAFNVMVIGAFLVVGATSVALLKKNKDSKS